MSAPRLPGRDRACRWRVLAAVGIGAVGELGVIGLLATGAWLLLSASLRPPILLLSVAIGAVQLFSFLRGAARYGERLASHSVGLMLQSRLRIWLYRRLERLVPAGLPGGNGGDLLARLISDTQEAQDLVVRAAIPVAAAAIAWCVTVAVAAALLPVAGWVLLAAGVLGAAGVATAVMLADRKAAALPAARGTVAAWTFGALAGGEELVALGAQEWALARLAACERMYGACTRAAATAAGLARAVAAFAGGAGLAGVAWAGAAALRAGRIGGVELGVLVFLALGAAAVLQGLPEAVARLPVSRASMARLVGLGALPGPAGAGAGQRLDLPPAPPPAAGMAAGQAPLRAPALRAPALWAPRLRAPTLRAPVLRLRRAAIGYPASAGLGLGGDGPDPGDVPGLGRCPVVSDLDLELAAGRPVALTGPSGSGKTLAAYALLRFVELTAGELTIDGTDARALPAEQVRAMLAWSPEQPSLFPASLRANLRVGAPHATDGELADVLAELRLGPWLDQLDRGLDTVLAPWGHPVSGGELQRVSVARALLADRPVLVLDEPTSHLDAVTAGAVLQSVLERAEKRSLLWITHRPEELAVFPVVCSLAQPAQQAVSLGDMRSAGLGRAARMVQITDLVRPRPADGRGR